MFRVDNGDTREALQLSLFGFFRFACFFVFVFVFVFFHLGKYPIYITLHLVISHLEFCSNITFLKMKQGDLENNWTRLHLSVKLYPVALKLLGTSLDGCISNSKLTNNNINWAFAESGFDLTWFRNPNK